MNEQTERLRQLAFKLWKNNPLSVRHDLAASGLEEACDTIDETCFYPLRLFSITRLIA
jgi:hypothetical protein